MCAKKKKTNPKQELEPQGSPQLRVIRHSAGKRYTPKTKPGLRAAPRCVLFRSHSLEIDRKSNVTFIAKMAKWKSKGIPEAPEISECFQEITQCEYFCTKDSS